MKFKDNIKMEQQIRCFGCGKVISNHIDNYWYYRDVFGLSEEDSVDKLNLFKTCCRSTIYGQTKVHERVQATGGVSGKNNVRPYPRMNIEEKEAKIVEFGNLDIISFRVISKFDGEKFEKTKIEFDVKRPKTEENPLNRKELQIDWDISDIDNYPIQEDLKRPFSINSGQSYIDINISPYIAGEKGNLRITLYKDATLGDVLTQIRTEIMDQNIDLYEAFFQSNLALRKPIEVAKMLKFAREADAPSIVDHFGNTLVGTFTSDKFSLRKPTISAKPKMQQKIAFYNSQINGETIESIENVSGEYKVNLSDGNYFIVGQFQVETDERVYNSGEDDTNEILIGSRIKGFDYVMNTTEERPIMSLVFGEENDEPFYSVFRSLSNVKFSMKME